MRVPRTKAVVAWFRLLRAALRPTRGSLTLDQLRSELSHETSAKLARLAGLAREWTRGGFAPEDLTTVEALAADLERVLLRQARLLCARLRTSFAAAELLARADMLRDSTRVWRARPPAPAEAAAALAAAVDAFRRESQALVESLCARFGERLGDLVIAAVGEVAHEYEGRADGAVSIAFEGEPRALGLWVPLADAAPWTDLLRNLVRNATQATLERWGDGAPRTPDPPPVTVRVRPPGERPVAAIEIVDDGVGMEAAQADAMWRAGHSTHGEHRGQGLTEGKRAFLTERAHLVVRSAPGTGTCVQLELAPRDVVVRLPHRWQLHPVAWPSAAALIALASVASIGMHGPTVSASIEDHRIVVARDARGRAVWRRDMGDRVEPNWWGRLIQLPSNPGDDARPALVPGAAGREPDVVVSTRTDSGTSRLWRLRRGGSVAWSRELHWAEPELMDSTETRMTRCAFQIPTAWGDDSLGAIAVNLRNRDDSPTAIEFYSPDGDSLGAYYHPGHLEPVGTFDLDGDGRRELLLSGLNNAVRRDSAFLPAPVHESVYIDCLVLLSTPEVNGQAYPYSRWRSLPRAREKAYLVFPPLNPYRRPEIMRIALGQRAGQGRARLAVYLFDGRVYHLDGRMRPLACEIGDNTEVARLAHPRAMARLLYIHDGVIERPDIPVGGGSR